MSLLSQRAKKGIYKAQNVPEQNPKTQVKGNLTQHLIGEYAHPYQAKAEPVPSLLILLDYWTVEVYFLIEEIQELRVELGNGK